MNHGTRIEWIGQDHGNDIPVHFSSRYLEEDVLRPPPRTGLSNPGVGSERFRWDHAIDQPAYFSRAHPRYSVDPVLSPPLRGGSSDYNRDFPWLSPPQASEPRFGTRTWTRQFEEPPILRPRTRSSIRIPFEPYPSVQMIPINMDRETGHRIAAFPRGIFPRLPSQGDNRHYTHDREKPTNLEQEKVLKMLKKEIYTSKPKNHRRRQDEDTKKCAVCLDDFEPGAEVMVTPCTHMFHEECIVPWVKSHGQCPVCRFVMSEQIQANAVALSSRNYTPADDLVFNGRLELVVRALDEAFMW